MAHLVVKYTWGRALVGLGCVNKGYVTFVSILFKKVSSWQTQSRCASFVIAAVAARQLWGATAFLTAHGLSARLLQRNTELGMQCQVLAFELRVLSRESLTIILDAPVGPDGVKELSRQTFQAALGNACRGHDDADATEGDLLVVDFGFLDLRDNSEEDAGDDVDDERSF